MKGIPLAFDLSDYFLTKPSEKYKTHLTYVGGFWGYKSKYLSSYILPLLYPNTTLSCRIFGNWGTPSAVGMANEETIRNHYASAVCCPNCYEPHSIELPFISDLNQRLYQILAVGGLEISQNATGIRDMFTEDELVTVESPKEFLEKFTYYSENPEERLAVIKRGIKRVYSEHTNLHRCSDLLNFIGLPDEAKKCLDKINEMNGELDARINRNFEK